MNPSRFPADEEAIEFLTNVVRVYSPSGHEEQVAQRVLRTMGELGFEAGIDSVGNVVGRMGEGERRILLLGHIDTVPGDIPVRRENNLLHGRGTVDAKGPFSAFVMAAARAGVLADTCVTVVGAVEEEAATSAGAYHVVEKHPRPDYVIIGEPSRWDRLTLAYKGRLLVDYCLEQPTSHTASLEVSACEQAVDFWLGVLHRVQAYNLGKTGSSPKLDPSLRSINSSNDGFRERVEMNIGLRLPMGLDLTGFVEQIMGVAKGTATVSMRGYEEPYRAGKRNDLTSAFLWAIRAEGGRAAFVSKTGTSDMNVVGPRWGCPILAYGPGDSALDHTPNEHIDLDEYLRAIRVLTRVLQRLASLPSGAQ